MMRCSVYRFAKFSFFETIAGISMLFCSNISQITYLIKRVAINIFPNFFHNKFLFKDIKYFVKLKIAK